MSPAGRKVLAVIRLMIRNLFYAVFRTPSGWVGILGSSDGLIRTTLPLPSEKEVISSLGNDFRRAALSPHRFEDLVKRFRTYFSGRRADFPDELDFGEATPFQREVWQATRKIPFGQTRSYGWLAGQIGKPGAARAVGQALSRNPLPIVVPCHRVLAGDGGLGGFSGGLETKKYLLTLEKTSAGE
jgi:methylated-DNA-[protein]-cysteine S-methyltransferase